MVTWKPVESEIKHEAQGGDPDEQEPVPEAVLNSHRVLQPEDEDVAGDGDGQEEQDPHPHQAILHHHLKPVKTLKPLLD